MTTAFLLVLFGVFARLNPDHVHNLVPLGAIALYAGARLSTRYAFAVPMIIMILTDLFIDLYLYPQYRRGPLDPSRLAVYGSYLAIVGLGRWTSRDAKFAVPVTMTLLGSMIFFLATNFAVWASGYSLQPMTFAGLIACFGDAVPFYRSTLAADFAGAVVFFGLDYAIRLALSSRPAAAIDAE